MSLQERYGFRDSCYSQWHRPNSVRRFVGIEKAQLLSMIDIDVVPWVEYDEKTKEALALIETALDVGQTMKPAYITKSLAKRAGLPCYVVLYKLSESVNPANCECRDITEFRVKRLLPEPETGWIKYSPKAWADMLVLMRSESAKKLDLEFTTCLSRG